MEVRDWVELGVCGLAHLGILANRYIVSPLVSKEIPEYRAISLPLEHIVHHATLAIGTDVFYRRDTDSRLSRAAATGVSLAKGVVWDIFVATKDYGHPQFDQFGYDVLGCALGYWYLSKRG